MQTEISSRFVCANYILKDYAYKAIKDDAFADKPTTEELRAAVYEHLEYIIRMGENRCNCVALEIRGDMHKWRKQMCDMSISYCIQYFFFLLKDLFNTFDMMDIYSESYDGQEEDA